MMQSEPQHLKKQIANLHTLPTLCGIGAESDDSHANFGASTLPKFLRSANGFAKQKSLAVHAPRPDLASQQTGSPDTTGWALIFIHHC